MARVLSPRGGFGAKLSSSAGFFGSHSDFVWVSIFGLFLGFFWVSLPQGGFGAFLRAAGRVRWNSIESGRRSFGADGEGAVAAGRNVASTAKETRRRGGAINRESRNQPFSVPQADRGSPSSVLKEKLAALGSTGILADHQMQLQHAKSQAAGQLTISNLTREAFLCGIRTVYQCTKAGCCVILTF